jgi:hypothetical protein
MVISQDVRGQGVGRALSQETFALALGAGLEKLSVQMTVDSRPRSRCSRAWVSRPRRSCATMCGMWTAKSTTSSCSGTMWRKVRAQMEAYGLPGAVQH